MSGNRGFMIYLFCSSLYLLLASTDHETSQDNLSLDVEGGDTVDISLPSVDNETQYVLLQDLYEEPTIHQTQTDVQIQTSSEGGSVRVHGPLIDLLARVAARTSSPRQRRRVNTLALQARVFTRVSSPRQQRRVNTLDAPRVSATACGGLKHKLQPSFQPGTAVFHTLTSDPDTGA
ncbi:hypothetical protein NDU88_001803 [Pleurodeles waltl]|uniref:Uncharacterized protein n=1 Tax=Pleurodeles waltl TaxID=8319 RepID=A0AAV7VYP9_PLEWA|nr:hypothetical protein NDU88_001803 [Pleurodeles waltl]